MAFEELKPSTEAEWLELRRKVLTATSIGALLGLHPWKSVADVKQGMEKREPLDNSYIWMGQELEGFIVAATNRVLKRNFKLLENGSRSFFVDMKRRLGATPDAGDETELLECKSTKPGNHFRWNYHPPAYYLAQLYVQLLATEKKTGLLSILGTDLTQLSPELKLQLSIHRLTRSEEMDQIFFDVVEAFWAAEDAGKTFRVNRKIAPITEVKLRLLSEKIYG